MTVQHLAGYTPRLNRNLLGNSTLPDWVSQGFPFPHHPEHSRLIEEYKEAEKRHSEANAVLQFAHLRHLENPGIPQNPESIKECQRQIEQSEKELQKAEQALKEFVNHEPNQRIALYQAEIDSLEAELLDSLAEENAYVQHLLDDPNAQRNRLSRIADGYTNAQAEYSHEQITRLRSLRNTTGEIEGRILNARRDIEQIRRLVVERERKARVQEAVDAAITKFDQTCSNLDQAWKELEAIAAEHKICVIRGDLRAPASATFNQGGNVIHIKLRN